MHVGLCGVVIMTRCAPYGGDIVRPRMPAGDAGLPPRQAPPNVSVQDAQMHPVTCSRPSGACWAAQLPPCCCEREVEYKHGLLLSKKETTYLAVRHA